MKIALLVSEYPACTIGVGVFGGKYFDLRPGFYSSGSLPRAITIHTRVWEDNIILSG